MRYTVAHDETKPYNYRNTVTYTNLPLTPNVSEDTVGLWATQIVNEPVIPLLHLPQPLSHLSLVQMPITIMYLLLRKIHPFNHPFTLFLM